MNENISDNLDFDNGLSVSFDFSSEEVAFTDRQVAVMDSEDGSEEENQEAAEADQEGSEESSQTPVIYVNDDILSHLDHNVNTLTGLVFVALVLVGCGLILKYIWGLLNK